MMLRLINISIKLLFLWNHLFKRINDLETPSKDDAHRTYQNTELMDVAKMFVSSYTCYYVTMELKLGNAHTNRIPAASCGHCSNCMGNNIYEPVNKVVLKSVLFNLFISG